MLATRQGTRGSVMAIKGYLKNQAMLVHASGDARERHGDKRIFEKSGKVRPRIRGRAGASYKVSFTARPIQTVAGNVHHFLKTDADPLH